MIREIQEKDEQSIFALYLAFIEEMCQYDKDDCNMDDEINLYVMPQARSMGIGNKLIANAMKWAREMKLFLGICTGKQVRISIRPRSL